MARVVELERKLYVADRWRIKWEGQREVFQVSKKISVFPAPFTMRLFRLNKEASSIGTVLDDPLPQPSFLLWKRPGPDVQAVSLQLSPTFNFFKYPKRLRTYLAN